jgi:hypothetical protein
MVRGLTLTFHMMPISCSAWYASHWGIHSNVMKRSGSPLLACSREVYYHVIVTIDGVWIGNRIY